MININSDTVQFEKLVADSETLKTKWVAVVEAIQGDIKNRFGLDVDESTVRMIGEARLMTLSNSPLSPDDYNKQVEALPQLAEIIRIREIQLGNAEIRKAAIDEVNSMPARGTWGREEKINRARVLGVATSGATYDESGLSHEQMVQHLLTVGNLAERLSLGRKWGLVK